jgi:hypothetical protein
MSLSEIFDNGDGALHTWANLRINNFTADGNVSFNGTITQRVLVTNFIEGGTTRAISTPITVLTIPLSNNNALYLVNVTAQGYTTLGTIGAGVYAKNVSSFTTVGGVITNNGTVETPINSRWGGYQMAPSTLLGIILSLFGQNILVQVQNDFPGNTMDWVVNVNLTTVN